MVTLSPPLPHALPSDYTVLWRALSILAVVACALEVGWYSLQSHEGSGSAWYAAPENVLRFSVLVFVVFFAWRPLSYLAPESLSQRMACSEDTLLLAFVAAYATYLAFIVGRAHFTGMRAPLDTLIYCAFAAIIPTILAASAYRRHARLLGDKAWRILRRAAVAYFWLIFAISGFGHFYGPHRPDSYFALSLFALTSAVLLRVIAALVRSLGRFPREQMISAR